MPPLPTLPPFSLPVPYTLRKTEILTIAPRAQAKLLDLLRDYDAEGLQVIDISAPTSPRIIGSVDTPEFAQDVAIGGNYAYIADSGGGLHAVDIMVPEYPRIVWSVDTPDFAHGVAIGGNYAYVADYAAGLQVFLASAGS